MREVCAVMDGILRHLPFFATCTVINFRRVVEDGRSVVFFGIGKSGVLVRKMRGSPGVKAGLRVPPHRT